MHWIKKGLIYSPASTDNWRVSHAQLPLADKVNKDVVRIYFGTRDGSNRTSTTFIESDADNLDQVVYVHDKPVLGLGELGCFDDSGAMPSWIIDVGDVKYLYYIGWNAGVTVPYRNSIGLAVSEDGGLTFTRLFKGPILDRTKSEPHFCAAPCVMIENGIWRMWYLSCVKWETINNASEPFYHIKYCESTDGINWNRNGVVSIDFKSPEEAGIVRSSVLHENGIYQMWYSYRGYENFRTDKRHSYRIGYAESDDGIGWNRKDDQVGIDISETGWDSDMVAYPYVFEHKGNKIMLYNGNGFGRSGFGYAILN